MRILLYSDLQLHPYKEFSTLLGGVNDRLLDHFNVLDQIYKYAVQNHIKVIMFGGDMFEARTRVDVVAAKMLADWKQKVSLAGIIQIDLVGNHDLCDKSTLNNALELYRHIPQQMIVNEPNWIDLNNGYSVLMVPFMHRLDDIKAGLNKVPTNWVKRENSIAIVHYGLYDVPMETHSVIRDQGYNTEGQIRLKDLEMLLSRVKHVFFGHFHITTSVTKNVHFIGTPLQHKWGERSVETRFLDIDLAKGTFTPVYTKAPRFMQWENIEDVDEKEIAGNFCRIKVENSDQQACARSKLEYNEARGIHIPIVKKKTEAAPRLNIDLSMSFHEMGTKLVDADVETQLDKNKLKTTLSDILKTASARMNA